MEEFYRILRKVPVGRVTTYKEISEATGLRSYRYAGRLLMKNPYSYVPCHRVVKTNGELGGFAKGSEKKRQLLEREGVYVEDGKIKNFENKFFRLC